jgi:hypothetical protein
MYCKCEKEDYLIVFHVNSEDLLVDLTVVFDENHFYRYTLEELDEIKITWKRYEEPFKDNKMKIVYSKKGTSKPTFVIKIKGERGVIVLNGKKCKIEFDWRR